MLNKTEAEIMRNWPEKNVDNPMVSIRCPAYNHEEYIANCLDGFLMQETNFPFEIVVHDDASTDRTAEIIREYEAKYPTIMRPIYETENQYRNGLTRKIMDSHMRGKYIATCEGDDYWCAPDKLQKQVDFLETHPDYSACVHNFTRFDHRSGEGKVMFPQTEGSFDNIIATEGQGSAYRGHDGDVCFDDIITRWCVNNFYQAASWVFHRKIYFDMPEFFKSLKIVSDWRWMIYFMLVGKVYYFKDVMSVYRFMLSGSWTSKNLTSTEMLMKGCVGEVESFRRLDAYSHKKYHSSFRWAINRREDKLCTYFYSHKNYGEILKNYKRAFMRSILRKLKSVLPWSSSVYSAPKIQPFESSISKARA